MATIPTLANYNIAPQPQMGSGSAYGAVPGPVGLPPSTYSQISDVMPGLNQLTGQAGQVVGSELAGQLPSGTIGSIQDAAAAFGVTSGMPGSGLQRNMGLESLGLSALQMQQQGLQNYQSLIPTIGSTMLSPDLISNIASQNALYAAAPDPTMAASTLTKLAGGGGGGITIGGGGGTKTVPGTTWSPANPNAPNPYGTTMPITPTGGTGTQSGTSSYGNDQWYYAGQVGPGVDPTMGNTIGSTGFDPDYYDYLVGGGDPYSYYSSDIGAGSSDSGD